LRPRHSPPFVVHFVEFGIGRTMPKPATRTSPLQGERSVVAFLVAQVPNLLTSEGRDLCAAQRPVGPDELCSGANRRFLIGRPLLVETARSAARVAQIANLLFRRLPTCMLRFMYPC